MYGAAYFEERAKGGVGLIVTGGISPNRQGWLAPAGGTMNSLFDVPQHRLVTHAVHKHGSKILMQILHAGRYGYQPFVVSSTAIKSPISPFKPRQLSEKNILIVPRLNSEFSKSSGNHLEMPQLYNPCHGIKRSPVAATAA